MQDLLGAVVEQQLEAFRTRKQASQLLQILSPDTLQEGIDTGRILSGGQDADTRLPLLADAVQSATQAFQDGFFYMFVNDEQIESLTQPVLTRDTIDVLFVRLTPLVGG